MSASIKKGLPDGLLYTRVHHVARLGCRDVGNTASWLCHSRLSGRETPSLERTLSGGRQLNSTSAYSISASSSHTPLERFISCLIMCLCVSVWTCACEYGCPRKPERGGRSGTGIIGGCGYWEFNSRTPEEQQELLTAQPPPPRVPEPPPPRVQEPPPPRVQEGLFFICISSSLSLSFAHEMRNS